MHVVYGGHTVYNSKDTEIREKKHVKFDTCLLWAISLHEQYS